MGVNSNMEVNPEMGGKPRSKGDGKHYGRREKRSGEWYFQSGGL